MIEIHAELYKLSRLIHDVGFVPCTKFVLNDVKEEKKVFFFLCHCSELLVIAFGLINTSSVLLSK